MDVSVVICTRNRARALQRVLESITRMDIPPGIAWELIVVDNGSSDETSAVVEQFGSRLPIRGVLEPSPGIANARNTGAAAAQGAYILWTDDDVEVDTGWLPAYVEAFRRWPKAAVFGGKITPSLEEPTVPWFAANAEVLGDLLAHRDLGDEPFRLCVFGDALPFGPNYAVRAVEQRAHPYDPRLGHSPGQARQGEETQVIRSILAAGVSGYWVPEAKVRHIIPRKRQTEEGIGTYYRRMGQTRAFLRQGQPAFLVGKAPLGLWISLGLRYALYRVAHRLRLPIWVRALVSFSVRAGELAYWRQQ